jgi:predicted RecA/RadA family phage recombinase
VKSGDGFLSGSLFAVAQCDADQATPVEGGPVGVWSLPKAGTPLTFAEGAAVFWDASAKTCKATGAGFYKIGVAVKAAGAEDTHVNVRLDGVSVSAVVGG